MKALKNCLRSDGPFATEAIIHNNVSRGNHLLLVESPDVQFVNRINSLNLRELLVSGRAISSRRNAVTYHFNIFLDILDINTFRGSLHKDASGSLCQGDRSAKDHDGDEDSNGGVNVVLLCALDSPHDKGRYDDTNIVDSITYHVKERAHHAQVLVTVSCGSYFVLVFNVAVDWLRYVSGDRGAEKVVGSRSAHCLPFQCRLRNWQIQ